MSTEFVLPPKALDCTSKIQDLLKSKRLLLFLDYDGTLTPIVANPSEAFLSTEMRSLLQDVSCHHTVSIVTGRSLDTIKNFVQPNADYGNLIFAASHGFHIELSKLKRQRIGQDFLPYLTKAIDLMTTNLQGVPGVNIEDNEFSVSVHYRHVPRDMIPLVEQQVDKTVARFSCLKKTFGKKVFEVRLNLDWDKGRAVLFLLEALGVSPMDDEMFPIYIGDDVSDEDAFRVVKNLPHGMSVLVSGGGCDGGGLSRASDATHHVRDPGEVLEFISSILKSSTNQTTDAATASGSGAAAMSPTEDATPGASTESKIFISCAS